MISELLHYDPIFFVAGFFALMFLIQLFYYWFFYSRLAFYRKKEEPIAEQPVSVVICAHNEAHNLIENLPLIMDQDYPDFEVIVVNDTSSDETREILLEFSQRYQNLRIVTVSNSVVFFRSKKFPLSVGIKSAQHDILLLTDADCRPSSNQWIRTMQSRFDQPTEIVLGFSPYEKKPGLLNFFVRYDALQVAMQYLSFALAGLPYMGVGRNLSYRKTLFYNQKGFIHHFKVNSGDDDLFINAAANGRNTKVEISRNTHVITRPKTSLAAWIIQKRRHLTTGRYYKSKFKFLLGLISLSSFLYYIFLVALLILQFQLVWVLAIHGFRLLNRMVLMHYSSRRLNQNNLYLTSLFFDPFFSFFNPFLAFTNLLFKSNRWK